MQAQKVSVLSVTLSPGNVVLQHVALRQRGGLAKVNHPHLSVARVVVDEKQRTADDLEEGK